MTIQLKNLGTAPTGAGGDTNRSGAAKDNENFSNQQHAASRMVGEAAGNVMQVGAFGLGDRLGSPYISKETNLTNIPNGLYGLENGGHAGLLIRQPGGAGFKRLTIFGFPADNNIPDAFYYAINLDDGKTLSELKSSRHILHTSRNTTTDSNGFIKKASPIIQLFADKLTANDEAVEQHPIFEKLDTGHYLIKDTEGFAKQGWWIQVPTDTNGNKICAVEYQTLENGDLEIKTFKKKLNDDGDIVASHDKPIDIPSNSNGEPRWIDIRLNELPKKPTVQRIPRTEKQPKMVKQLKYAPQLTYITKLEDLYDDEGKPVIVGGKNYQKPTTHIHTDANGTPILTDQQVMNEKGEPVFEFVQELDSDGKPVFEDVPVLDEDGNQIFDEVIHEP
ncbi:phage tail fiber protein [Acinetobacter pullicarnis]|uniref:phage tail fiber protein n=1 Tax=Acinetobacter pullicarnis TaxID=2576829 RepID=UPI00111D503E|nr:hypothetical protein [Acinetobacter pullicarnis]